MPPASRTVKQVIRDAVASGRFTSQRAILREVRSQGLKISNQSGRSLINQNRIEIARAQEKLEDFVEEQVRNFDNRLRKIADENEFLDFTFKEGDLRGRNDKFIENALRENIRQREVFVLDRSRGARLSSFTHAVVSYIAVGEVTYFIQGRQYQQETKTLEGTFTTTVEAFTEELLAEKVRTQLTGQIIQEFGQRTGLGTGSIIDGLDAKVSRLQINITKIEGRGSRPGGFGTTTRGRELDRIDLEAR